MGDRLKSMLLLLLFVIVILLGAKVSEHNEVLERSRLGLDEIDNREFRVAGLASFKEGDYYGFRRSDGRVMVKPEYSRVKNFRQGLAAVEKEGKWGYVNSVGRPIIEPIYDRAGYFNEDRALVVRDGQEILIDRRGRELREEIGPESYMIDKIFNYELRIQYGAGDLIYSYRLADNRPEAFYMDEIQKIKISGYDARELVEDRLLVLDYDKTREEIEYQILNSLNLSKGYLQMELTVKRLDQPVIYIKYK